MKKKAIFILVILAMIAMIMCIFKMDIGSGNYIKPYKMSKKVEDIARLSNMNEPISIFEYDLSGVDGFIHVERLAFDEKEGWQVIEESGIGSSNIRKGKIAFTFNREEDDFSFAFKSKGYAMSYPGKEDGEKLKNKEEFYFGELKRIDKTKISDGERIVLLISYSSDGSYYEYDEELFTDTKKLETLEKVECIAITFSKNT